MSIADRLLEGIRSRRYPPGSTLPSERVLADQFGVSRSSVREAIRVLEQAGVLSVRMGSGTYVSDDGGSEAAALRVLAALQGDHSPLDIIVGRRGLEPECARLAAQHAHASDLRELQRLIEAQAKCVADGTDPSEADLDFHLALSQASHNSVLAALVEHLTEMMKRQSLWREIKSRSLSHPGRAERYLAEHREILEHVSERDHDAAAESMAAHLDSIAAGLRDEVG
jgi:GntR family transcriptional repressor for pyruvate dehydrogenase complex